MMRTPVIAVVGSGNAEERDVSNARELGRLVADNGWVLITGGRNAGVMNAAGEGAKSADGLTVGILPDSETQISPNVDVAIVTGTGEARNNVIVLSADVVIACGADDPGTVSEVALALKAEKAVILIGSGDAATTFFQKIGSKLIFSASTPDEAIRIAEEVLRSGRRRDPP